MALIFAKFQHTYFEKILKDKVEYNILIKTENMYLFCGLCRFFYNAER